MDMGLREWLIIFGVIVIAGILFDGWRRMSGKGKLKFKLDHSLREQHDDDPEDPGILGPTRVVEPREPSLDVADEPAAPRPASRKRRDEPSAGNLDLFAGDEENVVGLAADADDVATRGREKPRKEERPRKEKPLSAKAPERDAAATGQVAGAPVDEVLVINVISRDEQGFKGPALLQNILESGLRFGDMDIFHRHESMSGNGEVLFSMANAVRPGTFDLDAIDDFHTPAVSFFLGLPGPRHPKQAFDLMVAAARKLSSELNGELKDEQRSVMTAQTIEHYRQRIVDFERKSLMLKR